MPYITHFNDPDGNALPIAAGTVYTVMIPAAGSADLYGWQTCPRGYELLIMDLSWMTEDLMLELKSDNAALVTDHNLTLHPDTGFLDISLDSLPEKESVFYIYVPTVADGGALNGAT